MFSITVEPHYEKVWLGENPAPATFPSNYPPLLHQWRTYQAEEPLIVNTYNTGTGKTKAALLRLLKRAQTIGFDKLSNAEDNALLIAPTNELLAQHQRDAQEFCTQNALPYRVMSISRADLDNYKGQTGFSEAELRRGAALHYLLQNARRLDGDTRWKATLVVVNPDIFYYALYFCYNHFDRITLFQDMLTLFNYIIIDELHYYNPKQFANFLFFISLSKHYGFTNRQFCLLTATPTPHVREYLKRLDIPIKWIRPEDEEETDQTREACALAPVTLQVYSLQELPDGLLTLAELEKEHIASWLHDDDDGAIISSALWRINQIYACLKPLISIELMGRLTGAETRQGRHDAKGKRLILATPTVDIGYNFDRLHKTRQNIDFLLLDARSSDEFIQRLGRAGRVLGKDQYEIYSRVVAVVDQELYEALKQFEGQQLSRQALRQLAEEHMPARHVLYSYIESGAVAEAFLPLYHLERMASQDEKPDLEALFEEVRNTFAPASTFTYQTMRGNIGRFMFRNKYYARFKTFPGDMAACLAKCKERLVDEQTYREKQKRKLWSNTPEAYEWLQKDLCEYFTEKARFSFRESFQAPLALVSDTKKLLSGELVTLYDALHIAQNYQAKYSETQKDWLQGISVRLPDGADEALVFCDLIELRKPEERLHIGLKLIANDYKKADWEAQFVYRTSEYRPGALYNLEVVALNSSRPLDETVKNMFRERYIPAFVAAEDSRTASELWRLQRQGQIFPRKLLVTFGDLKEGIYYVVLGTMALLVWTEILPKYRKIDERRADANDESPMIF